MNLAKSYQHRRTLIVGDINTGKSSRTQDILQRWIEKGLSARMTVLDLAPFSVKGIGGRLTRPPEFQGRYLATEIRPPRLTARDAVEAGQIAGANAAAIQTLWQPVLDAPTPILVINDATLYLQAGGYNCLRQVIATAATVLINAYYGHYFPDSSLTRRERRLTERLMGEMDQVIRCGAQGEKIRAEWKKGRGPS